MKTTDLIFLDTETTGMGPEDRLCQVAYVFAGEEYESLFKPPLPITIDAMAVTHITNKAVADKESFAGSEMEKHLAGIFAVGTVLVAHNAKFDAEMLRREGLDIGETIDTFKVAYHLDTAGVVPKYGLQYLRYYHDLEAEDASAHDALGDVRVLQKLFDFYFAQMLAVSGDEESVLREMLEISARPVLFRKFTFGKYTGRDVSAVAQEDADYLSWLLNQKIMTRERGEEDDENWIYTLDYYLKPKDAPR
ncbi:MAG: exonuclease domain-containing protein [Candidatus Moraniibacteriota bacterium]